MHCGHFFVFTIVFELLFCYLSSVSVWEVYVDVMSSSVSPSHLAPPSDVVPLLNSVIDVCLVYGVDETSSREIPVTEEGVREGGREGRRNSPLIQ